MPKEFLKNKNETWMKRRRLVSERVDSIIEAYNAEMYSEYLCRKGGDIITYRVYGDGMENAFLITER